MPKNMPGNGLLEIGMQKRTVVLVNVEFLWRLHPAQSLARF